MTVDATQFVATTLAERVRGIGTLRALEQVTLSAETAGRIRSIHFDEGAVVEEGAVLFPLNDDRLQQQLLDQRAALRMAKICAQEAERTLGRQRHRRARELVSEDEFDRVQSDLDSAHAEAKQAVAQVAVIEEEIAEMRLAEPFAGVMSTREVDRGACVGVGDALATLYRTDLMEAVFRAGTSPGATDAGAACPPHVGRVARRDVRGRGHVPESGGGRGAPHPDGARGNSESGSATAPGPVRSGLGAGRGTCGSSGGAGGSAGRYP